MPRNLIITLVALVALNAIVQSIVHKRHSLKKEHEIERLNDELRVLEAQIQTGASLSDFSAQFVKVRGAQLVAADAMTEDSAAAWDGLEACVQDCEYCWKLEIHPTGNVIYTPYLLVALPRYGIHPKLTSPDDLPQIIDSAACVTQLQERVVQDINALLESRRCPWPQPDNRPHIR